MFKSILSKRCRFAGVTLLIFMVVYMGIIVAHAQTPGEIEKARAFFNGKTLNFIVPYTPGGGFDTYARAIGLFLQKQIPGITTVIRNMPGGAGRVATTKVYNGRPDGLTIMIIDGPGMAFGQILVGKKIKYDLAKFSWIGRVSSEPPVLAVGKHTPFNSADDLIQSKRPIVFAERGKTNRNYLANAIICEALGIPVRSIFGFSGSGESMLAVERKEADGINLSVSTLLPHVKAGNFKPLVQLSNKRDPNMPEVPTAMEKAREGSKDFLTAAVNIFASDRSICAPPGVAPARLAVLRDALQNVYKDPEFVAWTQKAKRPVVSLGGDELQELMIDALKLSDKILPVLKKATQG